MFRFCALVFLAGAVFSSAAVRASDAERDDGIRESLIRGDRVISEQFDRMAEGIDEFLAGGKITKTKNNTRVTIENQAFTSEGQGPQNSVDLKVDLHLPNVEEYWELKFATYDENEDLRDTRNRYVRRTPRERSVGTSVALVKRLGRIRTRFQPRVELADPLRISHLLKFETDFEVKTFTVNPKVEFFARPEKGTGVFAGLNFDRPLGKAFTVTFVNSGEYQDYRNLFTASNGVNFSQRITDTQSMSYSLIFDSVGRPAFHLSSYDFAVGWHHRLFKNVLHYHIVPHWDFSKSRSFKGNVGLIAKVSLIF